MPSTATLGPRFPQLKLIAASIRSGFQIILCLVTVTMAGCASEGCSSKEGEVAPTANDIETRQQADTEVRPFARPLADYRLERTATRRLRGEYLVNGILRCALCHSPRDWSQPGAPPVAGLEMAGAVWADIPDQSYRMVAPNLTSDIEHGAGGWSDDALARAIREGVGHDGRALNPAMPYQTFRRLSDEDVASVVVYLRSLPAVQSELPERLVSQERQSEYDGIPTPLLGAVPSPDDDLLARGTYLIAIGECLGCHTNWYGSYNPGIFAGGNFIERHGAPEQENAYSTNITPAPSGIPYYDRDLFIRSIRGGTVVARRLRSTMPWVALRNLTDGDLDAIFTALSALPPRDHWVDNNAPPTFCPRCETEHGGGERNHAWQPPAHDPLPAALLEQYTGTYRFDDGTELTFVVHEDYLESPPTGRLYPLSDDRFATVNWGNSVRFERDTANEVTALISEDLDQWRAVRVGS